MKTGSKKLKRLAKKIDATDEKLKVLNDEVASISEPAAIHLKQRLAAVEIEEHALQRNYAEVMKNKKQGGKRTGERVETLLHHIEAEESAIEHEAEFLKMGAPSTLEYAFRVGTYFYKAWQRFIKKLLGDHHLPPKSPFVNTSISTLDKLRAQADTERQQ